MRLSTSTAYAAVLCAIATVWSMLQSEQTLHWFVIPVFLCGLLIGTDAVDYVRGRRALFDPVGIVGTLGFLFFFLAPLLHVQWDRWMRYIEPPDDWRPWLGAMAVFNVFGILLYKAALGRSNHPTPTRTYWRLSTTRFTLLLIVFSIICVATQLYVYRLYGGVVGFIGRDPGADVLEGYGWLVTIAEPFPILAVMGFAVWARGRAGISGYALIGCMVAYVVLALFFGGFRGSRANTIWGVFWAAAILNAWVRPIPRGPALAGVAAMIAFMYVYGFYKELYSGAAVLLTDPSIRRDLEAATGRTMKAVILGDLARSDVQAFLLYRVLRENADYRYKYGQTYFADVVSIVPRRIWPNRPPGKVRAGTEALYGNGVWETDHWRASNQYGLAGDALLNFGPFAMPWPFLGLGLYVRWVRKVQSQLLPGDARSLIMPLFVIIAFWLLVSDTDNVMWVLVKHGLVPAIVVLLSSTPSRVRDHAAGWPAGAASKRTL